MRLPRADGTFALKVFIAAGVMGAGVWWAAQQVDWIAMQAHRGQRAALLAGIIACAAVVYFALLALMGLRPRQFIRHA